MKVPAASILLVLLLGALTSPTVRADDYDETEYRLKTAGVDEAFRVEIHSAIRRGVAFLRKHQGRDGSYALNAGWTALAGLALRHAVIPKGVEGGRRAIRWLETRGRSHAIHQTYYAGLTAMLLKADGSGDELQRAIHAALAQGPLRDATGYWGYASAGGGAVPNLSTSQFGSLGLWAGERAGEPVNPTTWRKHLEALLDSQEDSGSWSYYPAGSPFKLGSRGYPTGTFMGLADLLLATEALADELSSDAELLVRVRLARSRALAALRRHVHWVVAAPERHNAVGYYAFYRLYALEKACIFLDREDVGGVPWYRLGVRWLLDQQERDGGWVSLEAPPAPQGNNVIVLRQPLETSFALLFLLRASESYRPVTPRPVGGGPVDRGPVITPGDHPSPPPPATRKEEAALPLPIADHILADLATRLENPTPENFPRILKALALLRRTLIQYRPGGVPRSELHDAWCKRTEDLLLEAATVFESTRSLPPEVHHAVALEALDLLASTSPRVGSRLMEQVQDVKLDKRFPPANRAAWFGGAMDALRRLDPQGLLPFLRGSVLSPRQEDWPRTSAALTALSGLPSLSGPERYATAKTVLTRLRPISRRVLPDPAASDLMMDVCVLIRGLARPRAKDDFPPLVGTNPRQDFKAVRTWFHGHDRPKARIWRD